MRQAEPIRVYQLAEFTRWLSELRDQKAQRSIDRRIARLRSGNFGDARPIAAGLSELRIDVGPGYRVFFIKRGNAIVVLLCGGDKSSQARDIALAKRLVKVAEDMVNASGG